MHFDHIAGGVLYLLWQRQRNDDASFVTAEVLREELLQGKANSEFSPKTKTTVVKGTLRDLKEAGIVESGVAEKNGYKPGPAPTGYRLEVDPPIITRRATAAIVWLLHNHRNRPLRRDALIEEVLELGLTHHDRPEPLSSQDVSGLIDWSIRKEYVIERDCVIDDTFSSVTEKRLITTAKVDECRLFLKKLADEVKRHVVSAKSS